MFVKLQLKGPLKKYGHSAEPFDCEIAAEPCTVRDLLQKLNIPTSSTSFVLIDGNKAGLTATLKGGEMVVVNPRVAGG